MRRVPAPLRRNVRLEFHKKMRMDACGFTKSRKCSFRISRFFEGAREKFHEKIVFGHGNFRAWKNWLVWNFARLRMSADQVLWIQFCGAQAEHICVIFQGFLRCGARQDRTIFAPRVGAQGVFLVNCRLALGVGVLEDKLDGEPIREAMGVHLVVCGCERDG